MEQYLNLVWKNYTSSLSQNSDENSFDETDETSDTFTNSELHYQIPFWIGVIVISLLFLSAIIATVRYCFHALCSSHAETERVALMPSKSPCLSPNVTNTNRRQKQHTDELTRLEQAQNYHSSKSFVPIVRQQSRPQLTSTRRHRLEIDTDDTSNHYFSPNQTVSSRVSFDSRKKIRDVYVLPVSPALSSSSSTTNTDEMIKTSSNTIPVRSQRHLSSSIDIHDQSTPRGIKNDCFTHSPQTKERTLTLSHAGTLRRTLPPSQPPPLPPATPQIHFNDSSKSSVDRPPIDVHLGLDPTVLQSTADERNQMKKPSPPPVPGRSQKPSVLPIGFEGLTERSIRIGFQPTVKSSPQEDYSEHAWPQPPESMSTSGISGRLSIPYDHLHHDHLLPTVVMRQNSTFTNVLHQYQPHEHSILSESET